ncbi:MAG: hypothetical protein GF350_11855, partial [Chitinivibrionales bacterium]|nr:hypothetical protein [Chitinivibrionales bacterium]
MFTFSSISKKVLSGCVVAAMLIVVAMSQMASALENSVQFTNFDEINNSVTKPGDYLTVRWRKTSFLLCFNVSWDGGQSWVHV